MAASLKTEFVIVILLFLSIKCSANDILGCGGFVKSHVKLNFAEIEIGLYTKEGSLKEKTECAPTNGYYFLPFYEKGEYVLKVHPPAGLSFEPSEVPITVDGVSDRCSMGQDINFAFNGFGINGRVVTQGQELGPSGIAVQLVNEKGETRNTVTTAGGEFRFTAVIPGKYTVKASHPRWKLDPSEAEVQMKDGKVPSGVVLTVKGYDVKGSVNSFGSPIQGVYVVLYSKEENPKYRVEGCNTALLQGVPDSPICHSTTDAAGEFSFGLVAAGEYRLLVLATSPGQVDLNYNIKPDAVPFTVRHDSLYIKNAFEVTGFTVVGTVVSQPGKGMSGVRVLLDGTPIGTSDGAGKFTLASLQPGVYTVSFQHERCEFDDIQVSVTTSGTRGAVVGRVARWMVCGSVAPRGDRRVSVLAGRGHVLTVPVSLDEGEWCTYLAPGVYTAQVEVSEQEKIEGLQFYPLSQKISVGHGPVEGISFSQLKAQVSGTVQCAGSPACDGVVVTLRALSPDGAYVGAPLTARVVDGAYTFSEVLPGTVEVSVPTDRVCWHAARHVVPVSAARAAVPPFSRRGYLLTILADHDIQVEYSSKSSSGVVSVPRGESAHCVSAAEVYTLTPVGCHQFQPPHAQLDTAANVSQKVEFVAVSHAVDIKVTSPEPAADLTLTIDTDNKSGQKVGPLAPTQDGGMYVYQHTIYLADGEISVVSASSSSLLFQPGGPQQVVGGADCQPAALLLRARAALTLAGRTEPRVHHVTFTLTEEDGKVTELSSPDGTYRFGPLDAAHKYKITAEKESYVFSPPDDQGLIKAHKLAEIIVDLLDDADGTSLQGALVSVSGGTYRRNVVSGGGALRFPSLSPAEYYVKPNMKEYKFSPHHHILTVVEGRTHQLTLRGTRVAWSCFGQVVSLGGAGWGGALLAAVPAHSSPRCHTEEANTEPSGAFRIRGLVPDCEYNIVLKESSAPELAGLRLVKAPSSLKIVNNTDITGVVLVGTQPAPVTDVHVLVHTPVPDHYRALRLTVSAERAPHTPLFSARLDQPPHSSNPGVMLVLPRVPADNRSYVVQLECSLSRAAHHYSDLAEYFLSDGQFKFISMDFQPKVKSSEQELRQSSFLLIPLLGALALLYSQRDRLLALRARGRAPRAPRAARPDLLDQASIDQILSTVNAAGKKQPKKKLS